MKDNTDFSYLLPYIIYTVKLFRCPPHQKPNSISISDIKSRVLNVAQTSIYTVKLGQPPGLSNFGEFEGVSSDDISNLELSCAETSLPGSALATHDVTNDYPGVREGLHIVEYMMKPSISHSTLTKNIKLLSTLTVG